MITGGMLISGLSVPPLHDARVVIRGDRIVAVGPASAIEIPAGATVIDTSGQTMMPGLIDAHAHLFMIGFGDEAGWFKWLQGAGKKYSIEKVMELSAWQLLMSGVTSAIDLGGNAGKLQGMDGRMPFRGHPPAEQVPPPAWKAANAIQRRQGRWPTRRESGYP